MISALQRKILGEVIVFIPITLLLILGIDELSGGVTSGVQHFMQLTPLFILALVSWIFPKIGGTIIAGSAIILAFVYLLLFPEFPIWAKLFNDIILFGLPLLAGLLIFSAGKNKQY